MVVLSKVIHVAFTQRMHKGIFCTLNNNFVKFKQLELLGVSEGRIVVMVEKKPALSV